MTAHESLPVQAADVHVGAAGGGDLIGLGAGRMNGGTARQRPGLMGRTAMRRIVRRGTIALLSGIWLSGVGLAAAGTPTAFIQHLTDRILQVLEDPHLQGPEHREDRLARLSHIADTAFDWEEIARRALAIHWRGRTPQERREFTALFRNVVQGAYLGRLEAAAQEHLAEERVIRYLGEQVDGVRAAVRTTIATTRYREIPLDYRLHYSREQWWIYDVMIEGISLVNNYRAQFHRIITRSSFDELVQQLRARQAEGTAVEAPGLPR